MKLIKLKQDHFIVVDETIQPINGYYYDFFINKIRNTNSAEYGEANHCWQITHSTQPLYKNSFFYRNDFWGIQELNLSEVKELIGEVDVIKKAVKFSELPFEGAVNDVKYNYCKEIGYISGYNQCLEDNKEKKYTEAQMRECWRASERFDRPSNEGYAPNFEEFIQSLQPETEWEVEIVDDKLKLKF